jgi:hypothetical protein
VPAWATVVLTLGASLIAVAGTLIATQWQTRHGTREREAAARSQRRTSGGRVLGRIQTLLLDSQPGTLAINWNNESFERFPQLVERWLVLRDELAVFAATDESPQVRETARELATQMTYSFNRVRALLEDQRRHESRINTGDVVALAEEHYRAAVRCTDELLSLIHDETPAEVGDRVDV